MLRNANRQTMPMSLLTPLLAVNPKQTHMEADVFYRMDGCAAGCPGPSQPRFHEKLQRDTKATGPRRRFRRL